MELGLSLQEGLVIQFYSDVADESAKCDDPSILSDVRIADRFPHSARGVLKGRVSVFRGIPPPRV